MLLYIFYGAIECTTLWATPNLRYREQLLEVQELQLYTTVRNTFFIVMTLTLTPTETPTQNVWTYSVGAWCQNRRGLGGIGVEGLTNHNAGGVRGAPRCSPTSLGLGLGLGHSAFMTA